MPVKTESLILIAERDFSAADQIWFAEVSGDINPMHMDAVAARRTIAGRPVVHGVHTLTWAIDALLRHAPGLAPVAAIDSRFERVVHVGDHAQALIVEREGQPAQLRVMVDGVAVMRLKLTSGDPVSDDGVMAADPVPRPASPIDLTIEQMAQCRGAVPLAAAEPLAERFPAAATALGSHRLAGLAAASFIVGMVCPGLHSMFGSLKLSAAMGPRLDDVLRFQVTGADARFRLVKIAVAGGGWSGSLETYARPEPTAQPDIASLATRVVPGEFAGASALVVGGSRGLGELVAKLLAAGGAEHVTITYALGENDARRVQGEIQDFGGRCDILRYDARQDAREQLGPLSDKPGQIYFMATPPIPQRKATIFDPRNFDQLMSVYVEGFHKLCTALREDAPAPLAIFYPSTVYVERRPANMTEYAMAKAAGELLCADMATFEKIGRIVVRRLPRLPTDLSAGLVQGEFDDPIEIMLPIVRDVQAG